MDKKNALMVMFLLDIVKIALHSGSKTCLDQITLLDKVL